MDEALPVAQARRRRWKRWTALALLLVIGCGVWMVSGDGGTIAKSRQIAIGQTHAEVEAVLGSPQGRFKVKAGQATVYATSAESFRMELLGLVPEFRRLIGAPGPYVWEGWPVQIDFDDYGRVWRIRRGSEVIER